MSGAHGYSRLTCTSGEFVEVYPTRLVVVVVAAAAAAVVAVVVVAVVVVAVRTCRAVRVVRAVVGHGRAQALSTNRARNRGWVRG